MILAAVLPWALAAVVIAMLLAGWRLWRGPTAADRILALDTLYVDALALLVLAGLWQGHTLFIEAAMLIGLLGFAGTVVLARLVARGSIVE